MLAILVKGHDKSKLGGWMSHTEDFPPETGVSVQDATKNRDCFEVMSHK